MGAPSMKKSRVVLFGTMALSAVLAAGSNLLLRQAMGELSGAALDGDLVIAVVTSPLVLIGIVGYGLSFLLWLHVLSQAKLGAAYPVYTSSLVVMVLIGSIAILGEQVTPARLGSVALITAGIVVAERGAR